MTRFGIGYDSHRFTDGRRLVLGGVDIPNGGRGLAGHSDADVLVHALCDALLGAVAEGDIGQHFPDSDPRWKNCDSTELLRIVTEHVRRKGWEIENTDATIIAESPKLLPHVPAMWSRLAEVMRIDVSRVSVKAKTNEGMDAAGRGEGIMVMSAAVVRSRGQEIGENLEC